VAWLLNPTHQNLKIAIRIFGFFHKNLLVAIFMNVSKKINFLLTTKKALMLFCIHFSNYQAETRGRELK